MSQIQAVFFDIDGTLFSTVDFAARARRASVRAMIHAGIDIEEEVLMEEQTD